MHPTLYPSAKTSAPRNRRPRKGTPSPNPVRVRVSRSHHRRRPLSEMSTRRPPGCELMTLPGWGGGDRRTPAVANIRFPGVASRGGIRSMRSRNLSSFVDTWVRGNDGLFFFYFFCWGWKCLKLYICVGGKNIRVLCKKNVS